MTHITKTRNTRRSGFSLLELLAVVTILAIIAVIIVPRIGYMLPNVKAQSSAENKSVINKAIEQWYFSTGTWPATNLSDIGADNNYFPSGIPTNPVDGSAYTMNATTHRVP